MQVSRIGERVKLGMTYNDQGRLWEYEMILRIEDIEDAAISTQPSLFKSKIKIVRATDNSNILMCLAVPESIIPPGCGSGSVVKASKFTEPQNADLKKREELTL